MVIDATAAVRIFLQAQSPLTAITRADTDLGIYRTPPGLPFKVEANDKPPRCVVVQEVAGPAGGSYPNIEPRFYLRTYGPTGPAAREVFNRVWDVFYPGGTARGPTHINNRWLMRWCNLDTGTAGIESGGWPFVVGVLQTAFDPTAGSH